MKLKLLKKDILIKKKDINDIIDSTIIVYSSEEQKEKINFFEVLEVSENVTMIKKGDVIMLEYLTHTHPMQWNGALCAITSEDDVVGIIEQ